MRPRYNNALSRLGYPAPAMPQAQRGLSMIELMISLVIGLIITAAVGSVFLSGGKNYRDNDRFARMQETGRFAVEAIANDVAMASFWGRVFVYPSITSALVSGSTVPVTSCNVTHAPQKSLVVINQASAAAAQPYCIDTTTFSTGTAVIAVKYTLGSPVNGAERMGGAYLRTASNAGQLVIFDGSNTPATTETDWEYVARVYYIRNTPDPNNGSRSIPVLARKYLVGANMNNDETLLDGVEDIQVELGIYPPPPTGYSGDANSMPSYYTAFPDNTEMLYAVTAKIYILVRSPEPDLVPINKTYRLGSRPVPKTDNYRRKVFTSTVPLRNIFYQVRTNSLSNM